MSLRVTLLPFAFVAAFAGLTLAVQAIAAAEEAAAMRPLTLIAFAP